jgi:polyhydroxyalkanoate synthase subunit PhaE
MDMFAYGKALADLWAVGGKALLSSQENALRAFADSMAKTANQPMTALMPNFTSDMTELTKASQSVMSLWSSAVELSTGLIQKLPQEEGSDSAANTVFRKMLDPRTWTAGTGDLDDILQRLAEGPRLADLWNVERKYAMVFQAWLALRRRSLEHTTIILEAWLSAANKIAEQIGAPPAEGQRPAAKEVLARWIETANQVLLEMQHSERFLQSQANLLKASTDLRFAQQELTEYYGQMFGFPTRRELDDVHRDVTELKRELRVSRRQARAAAAAPSELPPPQAARPRRAKEPNDGRTDDTARKPG